MTTLVLSPKKALALRTPSKIEVRRESFERSLTITEVEYLFHHGEVEVPVEDREEALNALARQALA